MLDLPYTFRTILFLLAFLSLANTPFLIFGVSPVLLRAAICSPYFRTGSTENSSLPISSTKGSNLAEIFLFSFAV
jgi:hypothetical protein